jgi:hypothetical protein
VLEHFLAADVARSISPDRQQDGNLIAWDLPGVFSPGGA